MKPKPFTQHGKCMIFHNHHVYIVTDEKSRDLLIERLNMAFAKGYSQAVKDIKNKSDKLLKEFGI